MKKLFKKVAGFAALALAALVPSMSANAATIYLDASAARWTSANLHYWGNGTGDIPGEQVTGKSYFFKFPNVPDNQNGSFLFQTKQGVWGDYNASKNASDVSVTFTDGHVYKLTAREGRWKFQDNIFYLYCKLADYSNWDFDNPKATFAFNPDNGYYEAKVTTKAGNNGNYFFISTLNTGSNRNWDSHNNNRYTTGDGDKDPIGTWQTAKIANSGSYLVKGAYTDLLFQFDLDNGKVRAITEVTPPTPTNIKVICKNTAKWDNVKISYWGDGQSANTYDMTKSSDDLWEYTISETWTLTGFKFTDGNGKEYAYTEAPVDNTTYTNGEYVAPPTPGEISWYLDNDQFTKVSDGEFTLTKSMTTDGFKLTMKKGSTTTGYNYNSNPSYGYGINSGTDLPLHVNNHTMNVNNVGNYSFTVYWDGNYWKMKTVKLDVPASMTIYYSSNKNSDNPKWDSAPMTLSQDGTKYTYLFKNAPQSCDLFMHFVDGEHNTYCLVDNIDTYTGGDGKEQAYQIKNSNNSNNDVKYNYGLSSTDLTITIDFTKKVITVLRADYVPPVPPVQPDNEYYFLGDVNNWMNDGTYKINVNGKEKEYGYGYSKAENGVRAEYQFVPTELNGDDSWYVLDMSKTKTGGKLWGQFIIVQDKGVFQPAKLEENRHDGRDVINWKGNWEQWSNAYDRTDKNNYLKETVKAYTDVPSNLADSAGVAEKVRRSNFHLDHNLYKGVKIYFNPTTSKIFMTYSDYQDFYIYLSTDADRKVNGDRKVNVIKESMNNDNYTLDFSSLRVVNSNGTIVSDTDNKMEHVVIDDGSEGDELPNGLKFTNYWKIKIPNGLEGPSGQKFMVSLYNAKDENAQKMTSIFLNNLYFIDGVRVFATPSADVEVAAVSYRIYGLPDDGDPENLQIFAADGTQKAVKEDPHDEFGWVALQWGKFGYHPTSTTWWAGTVPAEYTQKTGFYPSFKDEARTVYHEVPASHASDCIQWKITYGKRPSAANGMKKTRTGVQLNPATADLTVDRSDLNADWVLNGRHKELVIGVATGVEDIEMEDGEISEEGEAVAPVYYNLQGVRVAEPQHGLYIKVTGNKSEKILVK